MARGHVDVSERRLRPIYDALDNGNNKKALQEADKALKKQKDLLCAKALRGLALLRLGRLDECAQQVKVVHEECPADDATLQAMSICYREMHRLDMIAELYENAYTKDSKNEEVLSALFMAYVRIHNYKKQQQTAIKLHKLRPEKNPYYFWNVMSIVMQAHDADEALAQTMFLPLAERMCDKYAREDKIDAEAEVNLYIMVLERLGKYQEALDVLTGPLGQKLHSEPDYVETKMAELLVKLNKLPDINKIHRKLLLIKPDHWDFYVQYFNSLFQLLDLQWTPSIETDNTEETKQIDQKQSEEKDTENKEQPENNENGDESESKTKDNGVVNNLNDDESKTKDTVIDYTLQMALTFINAQIAATVSSNSRPLRGPFLAKLEFLKRLKHRQKCESESLDIEKPAELLLQYYERYGDKNCCFYDLKPYMGLLEEAEQRQFLQKLSDELQLNIDGQVIFPTDKNNMVRHLNVQQLARYAGVHNNSSLDDKMTLVKEFYLRHQDGLQFGKDLIPTDFQFSDDYVLLAVHVLNDAYLQSGDQQYLWQGCVLLEKALTQSPSNFQLKLLLIKLYCLLGAFGPCPTLYDSMEIKHIQNDSMGYIVTNHIARLGHISSAASLYETMLRFFSINHKETTEYLVQSYKYGSFAKIIEFVKFRERLKNSFQYATARTERMLLDFTMETLNTEGTEHMVTYMDVRPDEVGLGPWSDMRDNRDGKVMRSFDARVFDDSMAQESLEEEIAWLKLRNLMLRILGANSICARTLADELSSNGENHALTNGETESKVTLTRLSLANLIEEFKATLEQCKAFPIPDYPLCGSYRTRLNTYLALGLGEQLLTLNSILLDLHTVMDNRANQMESTTIELSENFMKTLSGLVSTNGSDVITESDSITNRFFNTDLLENLVLITEFIGYACILMGSCYRVVKPLKPTVSRKGKKRQQNVITIGASESVIKLCRTMKHGMETECETLIEIFRRMDSTVLSMELQALNISPVPGHSESSPDETLSSVNDAVKSKVLESYQISAREMLTFLHNKRQYLTSLTL